MCSATTTTTQLIVLLGLSSLCSQGLCCCVNPPCTAAELETVALQDPSKLELHFAKLRIFPFLRFSHHGNITKWTLLAAEGSGRGRPQLGIWRQISTTKYRKVAAELMNSCVIRRFNTLEVGEVLVHENVPNDPLPFQPGDVLGLLLRSARAAKYIPYLHNGSLIPGATPPLSYYIRRQGSPVADIFSVKQENGDNRIPLASFEMCLSEDNATSECSSCTGSQPQKDWTCLDNLIVPSPSPSPSVSPASNLFSTELLAVSVVVPLSVLVAALTVCLVTTVICCIYRAKHPEGHHTIFSTETTKPFSGVNMALEMKHGPPMPLPLPPSPSLPSYFPSKLEPEPVYEVINKKASY